ncbi:MAG: hypothetical protein ACTSX9_03915 [Candidatus Njordarchaeales archaeon]
MLEIYTPGHNYLTDTLIMWGIVRIVQECCDQEKSKVIGQGGRYRILLEAFDEERFANVFKTTLGEIINIAQVSDLQKSGKKISPGKALISERLQIGLDKDTRNGIVRVASNFLHDTPQLGVFIVDHIDKMMEGRLGRGDLYNLYIPLSGIYGKYLTGEYQYVDKPYKVCDHCILFSMLGFDSMMGFARKGGERIYSLLGFEGEAKISKLSQLLNQLWYIQGETLLSRALRAKASLTRLAQVFIMYLMMPQATRSQLPEIGWYMIIFSYDIGRTKRVSGFQIVDLVPIRNLIGKIEEEYSYLPRLVELLLEGASIDKGGDEVINLLAELSLNRNLYEAFRVLRALRVVVDRIDDKKRVKKDLLNIIDSPLADGLINAIS